MIWPRFLVRDEGMRMRESAPVEHPRLAASLARHSSGKASAARDESAVSAPQAGPLNGATDVASHTDGAFRHLPLLVAVPVLLAFYWLVTYGTWNPFTFEDFGQFYDAQARSLLNGRWDVPWEAISEEAFVRDGKFYGYFGFVPALPRMALNALYPTLEGRWSKLSLTVGCAFTLLMTHVVLLQIRRFVPKLQCAPERRVRLAHTLFLLTAGLGSTLIFLGSRSYTFHEAIIWGSSLSLAAFSAILSFQQTRKRRMFLLACVLAFLAFFTRGSVGSGPFAAIGFVLIDELRRWWKRRQTRSEEVRRPMLLMPAATIALIVLTFIGINYIKFRTIFEAVPLRMYYLMQQDYRRLLRTEGKHTSIVNVRTGAAAYFHPGHLKTTTSFPWTSAVTEATVMPESRIDVVEPYASLPASTPALVLLALIGLLTLPRSRASDGTSPGLPILAAALGGATVLTADAITHRYLHDFFPVLILLSGLGLWRVVATRRRLLGAAICLCLLPLVAFGVYANCAITFVYQREIVAAVPTERQEQLMKWSDAIDCRAGSGLDP